MQMIFCLLLLAIVAFQAESSLLTVANQKLGHFDGDIELHPKQRNGILKANAWPNGVIPYEYGTSWDGEQDRLIREAMSAIEASTCIRFVQRSNEKDYVVIKNSQGCSSQVGKVGGPQRVSLEADGCFAHDIIVHELLHAVGLWHEQSRYDRDQYLTIHWDNMYEAYKDQYRIIPEQNSSVYGIAYNYLSVMHYPALTCSKNGEIVMEPRDPYYIETMGNSYYGQESDWEKVRRIYECKDSFTPAPTTAATIPPRKLCRDTTEGCKKDDYCNTGGRMYCRKTCGFCEPNGPLCADKARNCLLYKRDCKTADWMKDQCDKTCDLCFGG